MIFKGRRILGRKQPPAGARKSGHPFSIFPTPLGKKVRLGLLYITPIYFLGKGRKQPPAGARKSGHPFFIFPTPLGKMKAFGVFGAAGPLFKGHK